MRTLSFVIVFTFFAVCSWSVGLGAQQKPAHTGESPSSLGGNIEHGQYIVEHVAMCIECHSPRDQNGDIIAGKEFLGAPIPLKVPSDWAMHAPRNRGLLGYDDELAIRLLTQGAIARDGHQLRPPMPRFRMTQQDAADVIAFMRSLR